MGPEGILEMNAKIDTRVSTENQSQDSQRSVYQESLAILDTGFGSFSLADKTEHMSLHTRNRTFEVEVSSDSPTTGTAPSLRLETHNYRSISSDSSFESPQYSRRESSSTALTATTYDPQDSDSDDDDLKLGKLKWYITEAERLKCTGELKKATPFFKMIIKQLTDNPALERTLKHNRLHYIVELVDIQASLKNWSDALITIQTSIGLSEDPALVGQVEHWQAWVYHRQGSLDSARSRCERAIKKMKKFRGRYEDSVVLMLQILEDMGKQDPEGGEEYEVEASYYRSLLSSQPEPLEPRYAGSIAELDARSESGRGPSMTTVPASAASSQHHVPVYELSPAPSIRKEATLVAASNIPARKPVSMSGSRKIIQQHGLDFDEGGGIIPGPQKKGSKSPELIAIREAITKNNFELADILFSDSRLRRYKLDVKYAGWGNDESEPIHLAVLGNNPDMVRLLLRKGVSVLSTTSKWNLTVLHIASLTPSVGCEMLEFLMDNGISPNGIDDSDNACRSLPLHLACATRESAKVQLLLRRGARLNARDFYNSSPLMVAASVVPGGSVHIKSLVDAGAFVNDSDKEGDTALHFAAKNLNLEGIKILLECGANRNFKNNKGKRPIDLAKAHGDCPAEIKSILKPDGKSTRRWF
ncbi:Palmitoyltransferase zdhhc13 [Orbilia blumenaviensis]|uniref:Palmitoyltransferase zdhhc13 n=1 Tax=Orbilia blumenaviensis TaxID=1796055 RepID=A0AAV9UFQ8_9PEZI